MDEELIAYLDRRFGEMSRSIEVLRQETSERFDTVDRRFEAVDQRFDSFGRETSERFDAFGRETSERFDAFGRETSERFDAFGRETSERFDAFGRKTSERFDAFGRETSERFERLEEQVRHTNVLVEELRSDVRGVAEGVMAVDQRLERLHGELERELEADRSVSRISYMELDRRLTAIDERVTRVETRIDAAKL